MNRTFDNPAVAAGVIAATVVVGLVAVGCAPEEMEGPEAEAPQEGAVQERVWVAQLRAVNEDLTGPIAGTAQVTIRGDQLLLQLNAEGVPPDMVHLQHTHGLTDGGTASCPGPDADANGDGVIDLVEAEATAGTTMIPLHTNPITMEIATDTYPQANQQGEILYWQPVVLEELREAFQQKFPGEDFAWGRRVVMVHGVPEGTELPETAQSLPDVPARVTLPIACGTLEEQ